MTAETVEPTSQPQQDWDPETYAYLYGLADKVATSVRRSYPMVDTEDLLQEGLMWAVAHPGALHIYLGHEDEAACTRLIMTAMKNAAREYAVKYRAGQRGDVMLEDDCWYPLDALKGTGKLAGKRGLLHHVYDTESWLSPEKPEGGSPRVKRDPAEGNNWLATLSDVSAALDKLRRENPEAADLIECHYRNGMTYESIGRMLQPPVSRETVSKRIDRAIKKIQEILGGPRPKRDPEEPGWENGLVGTRRAISNAAARAITDGGYDE